MKVSKSLLQKYVAGLCTPTERVLVETWLSSPDTEEVGLTQKDLESSERRVWQILTKDISEIQSDSSFKKDTHGYGLFKIAAAACVGLLLFGAGLFSNHLFENERSTTLEPSKIVSTQSTKTDLDYIMVRSSSEKPQKVFCDDCEVTFSGIIEISNPSQNTKTVFCNNKKLTLEPNSKYALISERIGETTSILQSDLISTSMTDRGKFKICT
ncbi:MAG: hypothetical protein AAGA43_16125 [Bacteroidota bacterium]